MYPATCRVALKEWAVTIKALDEGEQVLLLRKGGIHEKEFKVPYSEFFLYPTYEHQKEELLKAGFHSDIGKTLEQNDTPGLVFLSHWAEVTDVLEVSEQESVDALSPYYIWTTDYAQKRLHWRPRKPLAIMLVRVLRLIQPQALPIMDEYAGCKSWVELVEDLPVGSLRPALSDEEYQRKAEEVRRVIASTQGTLKVGQQ